jgi:acyl-CoA synthetase (AMP-forming)/AMP-acid ligase II
MPKGVIWRHEDVFRTLGGGMDFQTGEKVMDEWALAKAAVENAPRVSFPIAPLMHGAAQWGALGGLFNGNTVVLIPKFEPHGVWATVERERVNTLAITGDAMARPLVETLLESSYDTSSLIVISSSAAIFSPSVKDQFLELLPNVMISDAVGSSETGYSGAALVQKGAEQKGGGPTVKLGPDTIVLDEGGKPVQPGSGVIGMVARSGNVPLGYYKDPEKTAATFVTIEGRRYAIPGDFALVEANGSMTLLGRGSVSINSGGEKLFPEEVEAALKSHPAVFDCLVVGVRDERWGQRVVAVVQARPGQVPILEDLQAHARQHIAGYKVPRSLHLVDEVKRQPSGKPDYVWAQEYAAKAESATG